MRAVSDGTMKHFAAVAFALAAALAATSAHAQTLATDPSPSAPRLLVTPAAPRQRIEPMFSLRVAFGGAFALAPESGNAFALRGTIGSRVFFPTSNSNRWLFGSELGLDTTWGMDQRNATLISLGAMPGHLWGLTGLGWTMRGVYGWRDSGEAVWGLRHGVRMLLVGGVFDLELSHQYLTGDGGDEHQVQFSVGMDVGLIGHVLVGLMHPPSHR